MAFIVALILALVAQTLAALCALRLNWLYYGQRAWLFISGAAILMALLRLVSLLDVWDRPGDVHEDYVLWALTLASLTISLLMLAGMYLIEPLFRQIKQAQELLRRENRQLASAMQATAAEMELARNIQQGLLPQQPPELPAFEFAGASRPAEWTSGDYFDYFPLANGDLAVLVADASGHGTGPALLMSTTRASMRAFASSASDAGELMTSVNRMLCNDITDSRFVTAWVVAFDRNGPKACWVGAGQAAWICKAAGEDVELSPEHPPLGVGGSHELTARPLPALAKGDVLLSITDGILETENAQGKMLGIEPVLETIRRNRNGSADQIVRAIFSLAGEFTAGPQRDDYTVVIAKAV